MNLYSNSFDQSLCIWLCVCLLLLYVWVFMLMSMFLPSLCIWWVSGFICWWVCCVFVFRLLVLVSLRVYAGKFHTISFILTNTLTLTNDIKLHLFVSNIHWILDTGELNYKENFYNKFRKKEIFKLISIKRKTSEKIY